MTISTQTMGVITMAMVGVTGLAVSGSIAEQRSVGQRMLFYGVEELTMDIEIMEDWGEGSKVSKTLNTPVESLDVTGTDPQEIVFQQRSTTKRSPIHPIDDSFQVEVNGGGQLSEVSILCMNKTGSNQIKLYKGDC